ncbi:MAG: excinuclease ABC subunit UvrB [Deltaproteobacteria bacterium]|nr:excinuclease ABC subunit UvrB [Deltaproteobacteria bacterium]
MFTLTTPYAPQGDQPEAIRRLSAGVRQGLAHQVLLGVTGSGKTFTVACVIAEVQRPTLIVAPNKTLAAQLFNEFRQLFPQNAVEYFVSYYDYYQPEAYLPAQDLFIEKDASINETIDRLRHAATYALCTRNDVIIIASVSCIYGLGSPEAYGRMRVDVEQGAMVDRGELLRRLVEIQYQRNDVDFHRGTFRARGAVIEILPAYRETQAVRIELLGDTVERITEFDPLTGERIAELSKIAIYPNSHYVAPEQRLKHAMCGIREELAERLPMLKHHGKLLEAQRLQQRTEFDLEMLEATGFCKGIENYSRYLDGRGSGEAPMTLLDYFPRDFLCVLDESHLTVPQIGAMYNGDRARKNVLVEYGFRLPSAFDNRPLRFEEFTGKVGQCLYISATPAEYELRQAGGEVVEQVVRPTGLLDPTLSVRPVGTQVQDLLAEIRMRVQRGERVLVTTLTKRMAENLSTFYQEQGVRVRYLHADVETLERSAILRDLRRGTFDVLIGINLLREGLDLPEVSLVAILDADKEGFLRSTRSLIQTFGRAARNVNGTAILYADRMTDSMRRAIDETERRRIKQLAYNQAHGITPETVRREITDVLSSIYEADYAAVPDAEAPAVHGIDDIPLARIPREVEKLRKQMRKAAESLDFERAATLRDRVRALEDRQLHS